MVYESDFYTSRRPYRPSTYSVSPLTSVYYLSSLAPYIPYYYHYNLPMVTYIPRLSQAELIYRPSVRTVTRLATYPEAPHHVVRVRVRPSVVLRELDRIAYKHRPTHQYSSALEDFYRSEATKRHVSLVKAAVVASPYAQRPKRECKYCPKGSFYLDMVEWLLAFEDETRRIRADTVSLIQRARSVVPRGKSVVPLDTIYTYGYGYGDTIPYRFSNDAYVAKLLVPYRTVADTIRSMSYYSEPARRFTGRGHLACVHYSGNKAFSNRHPLYKEMSIRDDVNLLSFYAKNRLAAAGLAVDKAAVGESQEQTAALCA